MLDITKIISYIEIENLYKHISTLKSPRYPLFNEKELIFAAEYILNEFKKYGLNTAKKPFKIPGSDLEYYNVEGFFESNSEPELVIGSHYDSVYNCPGANDNLSSVAVMLEIARIISTKTDIKNIRFISFTLEESNPYYEKKKWDKSRALKLRGDDYFPTSFKNSHFFKELNALVLQTRNPDEDLWEIFSLIRKMYKKNHDPTEFESHFNYINMMQEIYKGKTLKSLYGQNALVGSNNWILKAKENNKNIIGIINLDTIGFTSKLPQSQSLPPGVSWSQFDTFKVDLKKNIGDFILISSDMYSKLIADIFCENCKLEQINLPYAHLHVPLKYDQIFNKFPDILRGDHGPFWKEGFRGIFLTDTGNLRFPFYHTSADTIDKLNFNFIKKISQATLVTIYQICELNKINIL